MWARIANAALGIWLMAAPDVLSYSGAAGNNHLIVGPVAASFAVIGMWEVARGARWVNLVLGVWLVASAFLLTGGGTVNGVLAGSLMAVLSLVRGKISKRFGGGWSALFRAV